MFSWIFTILALWASWFLADIHSDSTMENTIFPVMVVIFSINLLFRFVYLFDLNPAERRDERVAVNSRAWNGVSDNEGRDGFS